jgi:hypothetical protein
VSGTCGDGSVMLAGRNSSEAKNQVSQPNSDEIPTNYRALLSAAQTGVWVIGGIPSLQPFSALGGSRAPRRL